MVCSKANLIRLKINIDNEQIKQVQQFTYLGSNITEDGRSKTNIICRIAQAKRAFQDKSHILTTNSITLDSGDKEEIPHKLYLECSAIWIRNLDNKLNGKK